jgi:hypothetical protein
MSFMLAAPVYIMMLFSYDNYGYTYAKSYVVKDPMVCALATSDRHTNQHGSVGFCTRRLDMLADVAYDCDKERFPYIDNICEQKLPSELIYGPYGAIMYGLNHETETSYPAN